MATGRGLLCADCFDQTGRVREVYLHVGPMKTGSTFLQDLLWRHRDDLARQGYNHPGAHANEMWLATNDLQDGAFVNYEMPQASGVWAEVCRRVLAYDGPSVISHEVPGLSTEEHIDRIVRSLKPARLQVIVMARSLAAMLPSLWQESVKSVGHDGIKWPDFLASQRHTRAPVTDALLITQRWLAHVPAEQIHVITVPPAGTDPAVLLGRFSDALGIDTTSWPADAAATNVSMDMVQTELIRRLNQTSAASLDRACGTTFPTQSPKQTYLKRRSTCWSSHTQTPATQIASTSARLRRLKGADAEPDRKAQPRASALIGPNTSMAQSPCRLLACNVLEQVAEGEAVLVTVVAPRRAGTDADIPHHVVVHDRTGVAGPGEASDLEPGGTATLLAVR
jgi:hypothetical protein